MVAFTLSCSAAYSVLSSKIVGPGSLYEVGIAVIVISGFCTLVDELDFTIKKIIMLNKMTMPIIDKI
jgi:hypothetical protein